MSDQSDSAEATIRRNTVVELSLVIAAAGGLVGGTIWATKISVGQEMLQDAIHQIRDEQLPAVRDLIQDRTADRWTLIHMQRWVTRANREASIYARELGQWTEGDPQPVLHFPDPAGVATD